MTTAPIDEASDYTASTPLASEGTFTFREVLAPDRRNIASYFPQVTVTAEYTGIHKIRHIVIIMQENRSFDGYFGTFPGAEGIPAGVCVPDPVNGGCVRPFHDSADRNYGGPTDRAMPRPTSTAGRWTASWARRRRVRAAPRTIRTVEARSQRTR